MTRLSNIQLISPAIRAATDPEEEYDAAREAGLLRKIGGLAGSGLSAVGNALDLPGSFIRDAISAVAQGKKVNPFDQFLHPFSHNERGLSTSGRELITQMGLARPNAETGMRGWIDDPAEAARDIGGFAAEVVLDPFFAAPKLTAKAIKGAASPVGKAVAATNAGAKGIDLARAGGRQLGALFDSTVKGATSTAGRAFGRTATGVERAAKTAAYERMAPHLEAYHKFTAGMDSQQKIAANQRVLSAVEGVDNLPPEMAGLQSMVDDYRQLADSLPALEKSEGLISKNLDDLQADYATRRAFFFPGDKSQRDFPSRILSGRHGSQEGRRSVLRDVQGGTETINRLSLDKRFSGIAHQRKPSELTREFWDGKEKEFNAALREMGVPNFWKEDTRQLMKWVGNLDPRHVEQQIPKFPHNPIEDFTRRLELGERAVGMSRSIRETLGQEGNLRMAGDELAGDVPLREVLDAAGLDPEAAANLMDVPLKGAYVPKELAADMGRVAKAFQAPEELHPVLKAVDGFTRLWKGGQTGPFPAFHGRNLASGQVMNAMMGMWSPKSVRAIDRLVRTGKPIDDVPWEKLGTEYKGLSNQEATDLFARQAFADDVAPRGQGQSLEDIAGTTLASNIAADIPGVERFGFRDIARAAAPRNLAEANPLNIAGVASQTDVFAPMVAARMGGHYVESLNRLAPYLESRLKGASRTDAASKVRSAQVDYNALSKTEQRVMRRLFPFYTFSRGMAEHVTKELASNPGGRLGQTIRGQRIASETDSPLPEYVAQTGAIPVTEMDDGTKRFLTGLGLMHEDPLSFFGGGVGDVGIEAISRSNPLLKYPLEAFTGESFFQRGPMGGRDIRDADPPLGRLLTNLGLREELPGGGARPVFGPGFEHLLSNSPLSRTLTTARTVTDPRKYENNAIFPGDAAALNTLTGLRISDVSPAAQDRAISDVASAQARDELGGRLFNRVTIPKAEIEQNLLENPELADLQEVFNELQGSLSKRRRDRNQQRTLAEQQTPEAAQLRRDVEAARREQEVRLQLELAVGP